MKSDHPTERSLRLSAPRVLLTAVLLCGAALFDFDSLSRSATIQHVIVFSGSILLASCMRLWTVPIVSVLVSVFYFVLLNFARTVYQPVYWQQDAFLVILQIIANMIAVWVIGSAMHRFRIKSQLLQE